ncbi:MAG: hypothetical protein KDE00_04470 [Rhodobacteraceae bacterium]|nr:hypothetical protein [Paracoccaceae bacterium]
MVARDNLHSRVVFWLKIVLPLTALAILSTLFLFSRRIDTELALPYAEVDVEDLARDQRLTAPEFSGVTADGAAVTVLAAVARPGEAGASATDLAARYVTPDGLRIDLSAASGRLDSAANRLDLDGTVRIATSSGYRIEAPGLTSALDRTDISSSGRIRADAPFGRIDAGNMTIGQNDDTEGGYVMLFSGGVKLVYLPPKRDAP